MLDNEKDNDFKLVSRFKEGDHSAFDELMNLYENRIHGFLKRMCRCSEGVEDVLQNTFLTAFKSLSDFRGEASFKTWIYKVASTACLKMKRKKTASFEILLDDFLPTEATKEDRTKNSWLRTPTEELINNELNDHLKSSLAKLPEKYKVVLVLRDLEGLSAEETSTAIDISVSSVKSRLHRARLFMRKDLQNYYNERGTL